MFLPYKVVGEKEVSFESKNAIKYKNRDPPPPKDFSQPASQN
jgi:hypothetical protein